VEAHNGKIGVISEKEGAEFWFILPDSFILEEQ
jgi:signal transduction histidine kinase